MGAISKILVNDISNYLPSTMKFDQSDPNLPAIPGFSPKTFEIFSNTGCPEVNALSKSFRSLEKDVSEMTRLNEKLLISEKHERRDKILSLLIVAAAVTLLAVGIAGIVLSTIGPLSWFMLLPIGATLIGGLCIGASSLHCHYAFNHVSHLKKRINVFVQADKAGKYELALQKLLVYYEEDLRASIDNKIAFIQDKSASIDESSKLKESMDEDIQNLTNALLELDAIINIYKELK